MMSMRTCLQPKRKNRKRLGMRWTMMSRVSVEVTEPRNVLSDTQPERDNQESCQEKQMRLSGRCRLSAGMEAVSGECQTGAVMVADVEVAAVAASDMREGLMPT